MEEDICCGGGCGHNHEEEQFMTIITEDDTELKCSVIDIFELENRNTYIALLPVGQEEVIIYRYIEKQDDDFILENIETDEEFQEVEEAFFDIFSQELFDEDFFDEDFFDNDEDNDQDFFDE